MTTSQKNTSETPAIPSELKAEQALGLIGMGLMKKISSDGISSWDWSTSETGERSDLASLKQRLELTELAIQTGAPLSTSEVSQLLGAKPGASKTQRGGLIARRISRNVWKLSSADKETSHWRN